MKLIFLAALGAGTLSAIAWWLLRRLRRYPMDAIAAAAEISRDAYRAFPQLMSSADVAFLAAQPGFEPSIARKFRRARVRAARTYLRELRADFECLCRAARVMAANSPVDRSEMLSTVHREYVLFYRRLVLVHFRVILFAAGVPVPEFRGLADSLVRVQSAIGLPAVRAAEN